VDSVPPGAAVLLDEDEALVGPESWLVEDGRPAPVETVTFGTVFPETDTPGAEIGGTATGGTLIAGVLIAGVETAGGVTLTGGVETGGTVTGGTVTGGSATGATATGGTVTGGTVTVTPGVETGGIVTAGSACAPGSVSAAQKIAALTMIKGRLDTVDSFPVSPSCHRATARQCQRAVSSRLPRDLATAAG
jgi:hypothetical protein